MRKHTPGPWSQHEYSIGAEPFVVTPSNGDAPWVAFDLTVGAGDVIVAEVMMQAGAQCVYSHVTNEDECRANFHLIAAAPELLEALENAVSSLAAKSTNEESQELTNYRSIISKARGE